MPPRRVRRRAPLLLGIYLTTLAMACVPADAGLVSSPTEFGTEGPLAVPQSNLISGEVLLVETVTAVGDGAVLEERERQRRVTSAEVALGRLGTSMVPSLVALDVGGRARTVRRVEPTPIGPVEFTVSVSADGRIERLIGQQEGKAVLAIEYNWVAEAGAFRLVQEAQHFFREGNYVGRKVVSLNPVSVSAVSSEWRATGAVGGPVSAPAFAVPCEGAECPAYAQAEEGGGCCWLQLLGVVAAVVAEGLAGYGAILACLGSGVATSGLALVACLGFIAEGLVGFGIIDSAVDNYNECRERDCPDQLALASWRPSVWCGLALRESALGLGRSGNFGLMLRASS